MLCTLADFEINNVVLIQSEICKILDSDFTGDMFLKLYFPILAGINVMAEIDVPGHAESW